MVVQWRHFEDALAGKLERPDLDDYRQSFNDEYATHDRKDYFLPHDNRDCTQRRTQRQGANVTHETCAG